MNKEELLAEVRKLELILNLGERHGDIDSNLADDVWHLIDCIKKLDEPQKPVIPQFVADYIEYYKRAGLALGEWFTFDYGKEEVEVARWLYDNSIEENRRREYLLIDAIRYGYEVDKEQLYNVVNKKNYFMLRKYDGLVDIMRTSPSMSRDEFGKDTRFMLTEKEIKDYDKRFWAFAEEVKE